MARWIATVSSARPSPLAPKWRTSNSGEAAAGPAGEFPGGMFTGLGSASEPARGGEADVAARRRGQAGAPRTRARHRDVILPVEKIVDVQPEGQAVIQA